MRKIVFATNNAHKLSEIKAMLPEGVEILSLADIGCHEDIPETSDTLEGNALQKNSRYRFYPVTAVCYAVIQLSLPCTANSALRASILRIRFSPSSASERNSAMVFFICGSAFDL